MLPALFALVLAASPAPIKLAAPGWRSAGLSPEKVSFFNDFFAQQIQQHSALRITTSAEINQLIGLERQKALLACSDDSSACVTELVGALGVDGLITGNIAKTERSIIITLKVVNTRDAGALALASGRVKDEDGLADWLTEQAPKIAAQVETALRGHAAAPATPAAPAEATAQASGEGPGARAWIPLIAGGALVIGGGVLFGMSKSTASTLSRGDPSIKNSNDLNAAINGGKTNEVAGLVAGAVGLAAVGTGVVLWLLPRDAPRVSLGVGPEGAALVFAGSFR